MLRPLFIWILEKFNTVFRRYYLFLLFDKHLLVIFFTMKSVVIYAILELSDASYK